LILGSGNVVHNLRRVDWSQSDGSFDWARRFDEKVTEIMTSAPGDILSVVGDDDYSLAAPTPDHFIPLFSIAGLADAAHQQASVLVDGYAMGSLCMTCFNLGCTDVTVTGTGGAPAIPHIPANESNL
jgi:4,5-DOPA dioxygenase extradiol